MKLITINVSDEEHKQIKLEATEAGLSIKDYLLNPNPRTITTINDKNEPIVMVGELPDKTIGIRVDSTGLKFCKHGADPNFCKFRKNGKPCR